MADKDKLSDFVGDNSKEKSLRDILSSDDADIRKDNQQVAAKKLNRRFIFGGAGALVVIIFLAIFAIPQLFGDNTPTRHTSKVNQGIENTVTPPPLKWYEEPNVSVLPVTQPDFAKQPAPADSTQVSKDVLSYAQQTLSPTKLLANADVTLLSEAHGYTSDVSKAAKADGFPNPKFAFWTDEVFLSQSTDEVERLLNPTYGGWTNFQSSDSNAAHDFNTSPFTGIFSTAYQKANFNKADKSSLPFYADWKSNNYGLKNLLPNGYPRWFGTITNADVHFVYDQKALNYIANATYNVTYKAYTTDQQIITRTGTLTIQFTANTAAFHNPSEFRVVINQASLKVSS